MKKITQEAKRRDAMKFYLWMAVALISFLLLWFPPMKDRLTPQRWEYIAPFQRGLFSTPPRSTYETRIDFPRLLVAWLAIAGPIALLVPFRRKVSEWAWGRLRFFSNPQTRLIIIGCIGALVLLFAIGKIYQNYELNKMEAKSSYNQFLQRK